MYIHCNYMNIIYYQYIDVIPTRTVLGLSVKSAS